MSRKYFIEGHKSKENWEDENTLIVEPSQSFDSLQEATAKAREYFDRQKDLGLMVIFKKGSGGSKEGVKFIFRDDEGKLEESDLYW
jgi:hypothetical protein